MKNDEFLELAKEASVKAGKLLMRRFGGANRIIYKSDKDLVTEADVEAEKKIMSMIKKRFPDHGILAEESGDSRSKSDYTWVIDPLDGTNNFAYGLPLFGVSIALLDGKMPVVGVINMPVFGELYYSQREGGAFLNGKPVRVSGRKKLSKMPLVHDSDFVLNREKMLSGIGRLSDKVFNIRVLGAATANFVQVIRGTADIYVEYAIKPWDIAAGCMLVEEAGGKVTDFSGKRWTPWSKNLLVSNGKAHDAVLRIIRGQKI